MARLVYSLLLYLLTPLVVFYLYVLRGRKNPAYRLHFSERFGYGTPKADIIFHCASVGEVLAAVKLIQALLKQHPKQRILLTCNTPTGRAQIATSFAKELKSNQLSCVYLPLDLPHVQRRFLAASQAKICAILETELWANLLFYAKKQGMKTLLINARLSEKSFKGYQRVEALSRQIMQHIDVLACHHQADGERFVRLGLAKNRLQITGSIKFDLTISDSQRQFAEKYRAQLGTNKPIWIAGSTHPNEHQQVIAAHQQLLRTHPDALLIIAPRHLEQFDAVAELLTHSTLSFCRKSQQPYQQQQVLLADTMGELTQLYGCADIAFIGGSLIERGGHNPLEASAFAVPVLTGSHFYNFDHVYPALLAAEGAKVITDSNSLANTLAELFNHSEIRQKMGEQGRKVVEQNQGAIARTCTVFNEALEAFNER